MSLKEQAIIFIFQERTGVSPTEVTIEGLRVGAPQRGKDRASRVELVQVQELHL